MNPGRWVRAGAHHGLAFLAESLKRPERWPAIVFIVAAALGFAVFGAPDWEAIGGSDEEPVGVMPTEADLHSRLKVEPKDAHAWVDLGHSQFEKQERAAALHSYEQALALDASLASARMIDNLIACYGESCQSAADALIRTYGLEEAVPKLELLVEHPRYRTRYAALRTLERMRAATTNDYLALWSRDLESPVCDVRRNAVERLGRLGDRRALMVIRAAKKKDDAQTPWYRFTCLGRLAQDAEEQILARN